MTSLERGGGVACCTWHAVFHVRETVCVPEQACQEERLWEISASEKALTAV